MPKGKKTCPKCNLETGARAATCQCGHQFSGAKVINQQKIAESHKDIEIKKTAPTATAVENKKASIQSPIIYGPAGKCPCKPEGYNKGWPDGPASKEVIVDWIYKVLGSSNKNYSPHAIIYWSGSFWDINGLNCGEDYKRVRSIIIETLVPDEQSKLEFFF